MKSLLVVLLACVAIAAAANNCPGAFGSEGLNCTDASLCCGADTIYPSCRPADGSTKCCTYFKGATQCKPDEVCGGGGGPGASSYATCGPAGSTFCDRGAGGTGAFCNATQPTCCGFYGGSGFCCAPGCSCNNSYYSCDCPAPVRNNCPGASGSRGVNCASASLCCGAGTISPSCLPKDGSKKCCVHYASATQCNKKQVCGGSGGPGASSYAQCGPAGSTFCNQGTGQNTFCNSTTPKCCGNNGVLGFCCAPGCTCNNSQYSCDCPPPTPKPTPKPKTCKTAGPRGKPATCGNSQKCCGAKNSDAFCCPANKRCNNNKRTCV